MMKIIPAIKRKKKTKSSVEFTGFSVHMYFIQNCSCFQCCCFKINYFMYPCIKADVVLFRLILLK